MIQLKASQFNQLEETPLIGLHFSLSFFKVISLPSLNLHFSPFIFLLILQQKTLQSFLSLATQEKNGCLGKHLTLFPHHNRVMWVWWFQIHWWFQIPLFPNHNRVMWLCDTQYYKHRFSSICSHWFINDNWRNTKQIGWLCTHCRHGGQNPAMYLLQKWRHQQQQYVAAH